MLSSICKITSPYAIFFDMCRSIHINWHKIYDYCFDFEEIKFHCSFCRRQQNSLTHFKSFLMPVSSIHLLRLRTEYSLSGSGTHTQWASVCEWISMSVSKRVFVYANAPNTDEILIYRKVNNKRMPSCHIHTRSANKADSLSHFSQQDHILFGKFDFHRALNFFFAQWCAPEW